MAITTESRPNVGTGASGYLRFIDGIGFEGLGSAGFDDNDLLIISDEADDFLQGGDGHDELQGGGGNDILKGGDGNGILKGGDGDDDIDGQSGTEKLFGGAGNDILRAGDGYDRLSGGDGSDTFGFYGAGHFEIADFVVDQDRLFFDSEILNIHSFPELVSYITNVIDNGNSGFTAEFIEGAATIELVGVNINSITPDMIVFNL